MPSIIQSSALGCESSRVVARDAKALLSTLYFHRPTHADILSWALRWTPNFLRFDSQRIGILPRRKMKLCGAGGQSPIFLVLVDQLWKIRHLDITKRLWETKKILVHSNFSGRLIVHLDAPPPLACDQHSSSGHEKKSLWGQGIVPAKKAKIYLLLLISGGIRP